MKIIFCDQDGVLLDKTYSCNYLISGLDRLLIKKCAIIVPNSDTPALRLKNNFESIAGLRINTLAAERGAVVLHDKKEIFTVDVPMDELENYKISVYNLALRFNTEIYFGDSAGWIKNDKIFNANKNVVIFDSFRQASLGYYVRRTNGNGLAIVDDIFYDEFTTEVKKLIKPNYLNIEDYNESYGIAILSSSLATKTVGVEHIISIYGKKHQYYMIGDYKTDIIDNQKVSLLAVSNCSNDLKERADFVSSFEFTKGMMECIKYALID